MTRNNTYYSQPTTPKMKTILPLCMSMLLLTGLSACNSGPAVLEPTGKKSTFIMEEHVPSSPRERSVTYFGKPEKRELAKLHLRYGPPQNEQGITFDINKNKRSIMAETPVAATQKTSTHFSFGAHKDHKFLTGVTLKIRF